MRLDIFSDPICPWCYLGAVRLGKALALRPDHPLEIAWHPFQLNPDMPKKGMDRAEYLAHKFGDTDQIMAAYAPLVEHAEAEDIPLHLSAITRTPNTLDAHRLMHWAEVEAAQHQGRPQGAALGPQGALAMKLFEAYFVMGRDIGARETLIEIGAEAGLSAPLLERLFESPADCDDLRARDADARAKGVRGVPGFLIAQQYFVSGAQPVSFWIEVIDELSALTPPG